MIEFTHKASHYFHGVSLKRTTWASLSSSTALFVILSEVRVS